MLNQSQLVSFMEQHLRYTLHFCEGQKLVQDLVLTHHLKGDGLHFFRDIVLSAIPLISFLKPGEGMGVYIDSQNPKFHFKLEVQHNGNLRTLLLPEEFNNFPQKIWGQARLIKFLPQQKAPYTSVISLSGVPLKEVLNQILITSFQTQGHIYVSQNYDHSLLISQLPEIPIQHYKEINETPEGTPQQIFQQFLQTAKTNIIPHMEQNFVDINQIASEFGKAQFSLLTNKEIKFQCNCNMQRMLNGLTLALRSGAIDLLDPNEEIIETRCDYCKKRFIIPVQDLLKNELNESH